jgi:uncharacterized membrane protein
VGLPVLLSLFGLMTRKNNGNMTLFIAGMAILSLGTYLMRLGGAKLGSRLALSERSQALLSDAATVLLFSVALATTFYEGEHFAGMARVLGVGFAVFLAWRKMPLIVVIIAAAVVTALLRLAGLPRPDRRKRQSASRRCRQPICFDPTDSRHIQRLLLIHREDRAQSHRLSPFSQLGQLRQILFAGVARPTILQPRGIARHRKLRRDVVPDLNHFLNARLMQQSLQRLPRLKTEPGVD